jgi:maleate cis-trans isomerase
VTDHLVDVLHAAGITVVRVASFDVPSGEDAGRLGPDAVRSMVGTDLHPEAVAVLVPDTALHTVAVVADLEVTLGVPVLTANLVTTWWGLRLAGWTGQARGLGALFEPV